MSALPRRCKVCGEPIVRFACDLTGGDWMHDRPGDDPNGGADHTAVPADTRSARRQIIAALSEDSYGGIATLTDVEHAEQLADAHRLEVLRKAVGRLRAIPVTCTALTGPVWYGDGWDSAITQLEEIADYQTPDDEAFPGELERLRTLALQLRVAVIRKGDLAEAERLLSVFEEVRKKATAPAATATPALTDRQAWLLARITAEGGRWKTGRARTAYSQGPFGSVGVDRVRRDLQIIHRHGYLDEHDESGVRFYLLNSRKDVRP